ncbi:hypothetical protein [Clostridium sp. AF32-12BH]|uniref:hypothetical protein n=1 Tax=Clostridium sp. AF32-12BH TaxID=2292006 RepID=UPI000E4C7B26|nr:hypothetical protein [Clostridium sp. AF32-12BH]RHP47006.1 hypothetical protein DWZ40_08870 [Clostridium sp. AF32-12BH]
MRISRKELEQDNIITNKALRCQLVERFNILETVKKLILLPETEMISLGQIAEYYEVSEQRIKDVYTQNREEIDEDGTKILPKNFYTDVLRDKTSVKANQTSVTYIFSDGQIVKINNRGLKVFSKRAVLRIGMLLRKSKVAKEVRNQLLNTIEKAAPEVKTADINEEQKLMLKVGMAVASGDANEVAIATTNLIAFKNRHIAKLEKDNKGLAGQILEWSDRSKLNAGVRKLAAVTGIKFPNVWNELYKNLQYKYGIALKQRGGSPFIQWVKESEWENVIKTFCAMCEAYNVSPTDMFQQTTPKINQ